jgi:hypothetical protein
VAASATVISGQQGGTNPCPTAGGAVDPTLAVYDVHGNELYNQANAAYLVLAPGFAPVPRLLSISVNEGPSSGGTTVTITGTGTVTGATFGGETTSAYSIDDSTAAVYALPQESPFAPGPYTIRITTVGGTTPSTDADIFTYVMPPPPPPRPTVTSVSPDTGPADGGPTVTISGTGFTGAVSVYFGSTPAMSFNVNTDPSIVAVAPAGTPGPVDVTVSNADGAASTVSVADEFTYVAQSTPPGGGGTGGTGGGGTTGTGGGSPGGGSTGAGGGATTGATVTHPASCKVSSSGRPALSHQAAHGRRLLRAPLAVALTCDQTARVTVRSVLTDAGASHHRTLRLRLATVTMTARAGVALLLRLWLPAAAVGDLARGSVESVTVHVLTTNSGGAGSSTATIGPLRR